MTESEVVGMLTPSEYRAVKHLFENYGWFIEQKLKEPR